MTNGSERGMRENMERGAAMSKRITALRCDVKKGCGAALDLFRNVGKLVLLVHISNGLGFTRFLQWHPRRLGGYMHFI